MVLPLLLLHDGAADARTAAPTRPTPPPHREVLAAAERPTPPAPTPTTSPSTTPAPVAAPAARQAAPTTTAPPASLAPRTLATSPVRLVVPTTTTVPPTTTTTTTLPAGSDRGTGQVTYYDHPAGRCASPWLPFGTVVTITNPATGATVVCTVDDREADTARAIDLSTATFAQLAPLWQGVVDAHLRW